MAEYTEHQGESGAFTGFYYIYGQKARFCLSSCFKHKEICECPRQHLAGGGPGFDSKYKELNSITIQSDPSQHTCGPEITPFLIPEVPDTLTVPRHADQKGAVAEAIILKNSWPHKTFFKS